MKYLLTIAMVFVGLLCQAQKTVPTKSPTDKAVPTKSQTDRWYNEMRAYKTEYIANALDLTPEQKEKFVPVYNAMNSELDKISQETRTLERKVSKNEKASDLEYEKAAEALFEMRSREGAVDQRYYQQFKAILSKKQLFKLKAAERHFGRHLMKEREGKGKRDKKH